MADLNTVIEKAATLPLDEWEIGDTLDVIDCYDKEHVVHTVVDGVELEGTGMVSCGDLVRVEDIDVPWKG